MLETSAELEKDRIQIQYGNKEGMARILIWWR